MSASSQPYERLSRSRFGLNGFGSLWLGKDHIMLVKSSFAVERYRRWFLREIQAVVVRRTSARLIWNSVLGVFAALLLAGAGGCLYASTTSNAPDDVVAMGVTAAVLGLAGIAFVVAMAVNTSLGPACSVFVQTPHGLDRLSTPNRIQAIEKLIAQLQPQLLNLQSKPGQQSDSLREVAAALDLPPS
jgi:hypothetical protein